LRGKSSPDRYRKIRCAAGVSPAVQNISARLKSGSSLVKLPAPPARPWKNPVTLANDAQLNLL
jgi:hypothetical protein